MPAMPAAETRKLLDPAHLIRLQPYPLLARTAVLGFLSGLHRSVLHGFGSEFVQYRAYSPGEDLKYVDWKLYARSDRLYTKVYEEETNMNVTLVLDASSSMGYRGSRAPCSKLDYACMVVACLAWLADHQGDNIGLLSYHTELVACLPPGHRSQQLQRLLVELTRARPTGAADHQLALDWLERRHANRSLVIFVSDMLGDEAQLAEGLRRLRLRHGECLAIQVLDPDERDLPRAGGTRFRDLESGHELLTHPAAVGDRHDAAMSAFNARMAAAFAREEVDFLPLQSTDNLGLALAAYLHQRELKP
jgi:uncharacterized protein (DUF58 family)